MPTLTRWYVKAALIYLVAALLLVFLLALNRVVDLPRFVGLLSPAYFHFFLLGWITQMIFGVAYWIFPRLRPGPPRGNVRLAVAALVLLNTGIWLVVGGTTWRGPGALVLLGRFCQFAGIGAFGAVLWSRIMPFPEE